MVRVSASYCVGRRRHRALPLALRAALPPSSSPREPPRRLDALSARYRTLLEVIHPMAVDARIREEVNDPRRVLRVLRPGLLDRVAGLAARLANAFSREIRQWLLSLESWVRRGRGLARGVAVKLERPNGSHARPGVHLTTAGCGRPWRAYLPWPGLDTGPTAGST